MRPLQHFAEVVHDETDVALKHRADVVHSPDFVDDAAWAGVTQFHLHEVVKSWPHAEYRYPAWDRSNPFTVVRKKHFCLQREVRLSRLASFGVVVDTNGALDDAGRGVIEVAAPNLEAPSFHVAGADRWRCRGHDH